MLKIFIQGLKDGEYDIEASSPVSKIPDIYPEFFGDIEFTGKMRILGRRYTITGTASCNAKLLCDLTLTEFEENISADIKVSFEAVETAGRHKTETNESDYSQYEIDEDEKYLDLSGEIKEELEVSIPMKRIAPQFRDKAFEDIFPEFSPKAKPSKGKKIKPEEVDDRWAPLISLKNKKN